MRSLLLLEQRAIHVQGTAKFSDGTDDQKFHFDAVPLFLGRDLTWRSIGCNQSAVAKRLKARLTCRKLTFFTGTAPQVGQRTASTGFGLSSFFMALASAGDGRPRCSEDRERG
jgi:hypothetical protein